MRSLSIDGIDVPVNNIQVFSIATEMQQRVSFVLLASYKIFCTNIFSIIIALSSLHTKLYISTYVPSRKRQITDSKVNVKLGVHRIEIATCQPSGPYNLEVAPIIFGKFVGP
jgi:hypothetical protein